MFATFAPDVTSSFAWVRRSRDALATIFRRFRKYDPGRILKVAAFMDDLGHRSPSF